MARNVLRGGGKAVKEQVVGLKELERKLKALLPDSPEMARDLQVIVAKASVEMRNEMAAQAQAAGWGSQSIRTGKGIVTGEDAIKSLFAYGRPKESRRSKVSGLAGVTKKKTMVEWIAGKHPKSPRAKVAPGKPVAMAFATMLEFGTSRMPARPAIRTAVKTARQRIVTAVSDGFRTVLEKYSK